MGILASVIANANRDRKKRPEPFTPDYFMPFIERPAPQDELSANLKATFSQFKVDKPVKKVKG